MEAQTKSFDDYKPLADIVFDAFDTKVTSNIYALDPRDPKADPACCAGVVNPDVVWELKQLHKLWDFNLPTSDITHINNAPANDRITVKPATLELLTRAIEYCKRYPVLDITCGALTYLYKTCETLPSNEEIAEAKSHCGLDKLIVDAETNGVTKLDGDLKLDIGAFAKGYAADVVHALYVNNSVTSGLASLGGQLTVVGKDPRGDNWNIQVGTPENFIGKDGTSNAPWFNVNSATIATSGNTNRSRKIEGKTLGHIINVETGKPAEDGKDATDLAVVTAIGIDGFACDALATAAFIMGSASLQQLAEENEGINFIAITNSNEVISTFK